MSLAMRCLAIRPRAAFLSFLVALYFFMAACAPDRSAVGAAPDTQGKAITCGADVPPGEQCGGGGGGGARGGQSLRTARRRRASEGVRGGREGKGGGYLRGGEALDGVDGEETLHELLGLLGDVVPPW